MPKISKKNKKSVRLASHVIPEHYSLHIKPDLETFTFYGKETISLILTKPEKSITLHSKDLEIDVAEAEFERKKIFALKTSYDTKSETATFLFSRKLPKGKNKITPCFPRGVK